MCTKLTYVMIRIQANALLCAFVALSMLLILQPASAEVMFYADFEDGVGANDPAQWVPDNTGQKWGIANFPGSGKGLRNLNEGCAASGNTPLPGVTNFKDGIIQLDMSWDDDDSWGVVFRKTADNAGYLVVFGYIETPGVLITDLADGCAATGNCLDQVGCENGGKELIQVPHGLGAGLTQDLSVSYTGRIEVKGDLIKVWFLPTKSIADPLGDLGKPLVEFRHGAHAGPGSVGIWQESQGGSMIDNVMVSGLGSQPLAWNPSPRDGTLLTDTWANLTWSPGDFAVAHNVYISDSFADVNAGTGASFWGKQAVNSLLVGFPNSPYPDGLVPGTTYYWRVDEVNDANAASPWKGEIWDFSIAPRTAYNPKPADGAESVALSAKLTWTPGYGAKLHTVYLGENFDTVSSATTGGTLLGVASYSPTSLKSGKLYYWRIDETNPPNTYKGQVWSFTTAGAVGNPYPSNGNASVEVNPILTWTPGSAAASHEVYFGTDKETVRKATGTSPEYKGTRARGAESYDPGLLARDSTYYWRVDEVNNTNPNSPWKGPVWSFTTGSFLLVDSFESYNDIDPPGAGSNRIFDKWIDGFGTTTNGALVGNNLPPYAERAIVHGGAQSMPLAYDNNLKFSEATMTLTGPARDWTREGVANLSLWVRGASANSAERMYVALNGTAVVYHDNPSASQTSWWTEWVIPLKAFSDLGVGLNNVTSLTIGLGTRGSTTVAGGTGKVYIDDIRLNR